jgi:cysteine desulfurase
MGVALRLALSELADTAPRLARLRDRVREAVLAVPNVELTGHPRKRLPGHLSVVARETDGESIVMNLDLAGIAASTGAACTTGSTEPSHVLTALGYPEDEARGSLRLTLGRTTTDEDIDRAVEIIPRTIAEARASAAALAADPLGERVGA